MKRRRGLSEIRFLVLKPERSGLIDMLISSDDSEEIVKARCHYTRAEVDGIIYDLYYDAHVQGNTVAYEEGVRAQLENKLFLKDATSDLPAISYSSCLCSYIIFA